MASRERRLAKNTMWLMLGKICTQCVGFFMLPLYTSVLATSEYGIADLVTTYIALFIPIISLQFEQGLFRMLLDVRKLKEEQTKLFSSVLICNFLQIVLFTLILLVVQTFFSFSYLYFLFIIVPLQILQGSLLQFARGVDKTNYYSIASFIYATIHVVSNVVFVGIFGIGVDGLFYSMIIASLMSVFYLLFVLKLWRYFLFKAFDVNEIKKIAKFSMPLIPNQLAWWIIDASDRTIIFIFIGTGANGIYSIANKFSAIFITFYNYFNMSWTESVSLSIKDKDTDKYVNKMINMFFNMLTSICLLIIAFMPALFGILINEQYYEAYNLIPILMVAVFFQALQGLYSALYVALKKTSDIAKTSAFAAIINITVNLLLIKILGLYAAAISTLVAFSAMTIYRYFDIRKYISFRIYKKNILFAIVITCLVLIGYYIGGVTSTLLSITITLGYSILCNITLIRKVMNMLLKYKRKR